MRPTPDNCPTKKHTTQQLAPAYPASPSWKSDFPPSQAVEFILLVADSLCSTLAAHLGLFW
jgi:hypothetical protein